MPLLSSLLRNTFSNSLGLLLIAGSVLAIGTPVSAMMIEGWKYDPQKGEVELEIADGVKPRHFLMAQPARIVVDLQDTQMGSAPAQMTYTSGPIQRITVEQLQPQLTRVTLYMFPSTVFAKGQVAIDRLGDGNRGTSDVWTLRPLLKGMESPASATPPTAPPLLQIKTQTQTLTQTQPPVSQAIPIAVPAMKPELAIVPRLSTIKPATPPQLDEMPPGMAAVVQTVKTPAKPATNLSALPIKLETVKPEAIKPETSKPETSKPETAKPETPKPEKLKPELPQTVSVPIAPPSVTTLFPPTAQMPVSTSIPIAVPAPQTVAKAENIVLPDSLPTLAPAVPQPSTVSVPPLSTINQSPSKSFPLPDRLPQQVTQPIQSPSSQVLPQSSFPLPDRLPVVIPNQPAPMPQQPSIFPAAGIAQPVDRNPIASNPATVQPNVISFGQPLVTSLPPFSALPSQLQNVNQSSAIVLRSSSDGRVGLPAGTMLMARYTGISPIVVKGESRKEILTLQSAIRDRNGLILAPEGTTIYGAFVGKENRFVAESIVLQGQTISLVAESSNLGGSRNPSERSLLQNSGIGLLAGVLIGGLSGGNAVGGAAAGAIVSYATAPQSATIQPGQTLELKLTQDWIIPFAASVSQSVGG